MDRGADAVLFGPAGASLAQLLAIGHEFRFDAGVGPPLAYWLAEIAFRGAGMFGVYVLAQICVVTTYWCVFALGRAIVGPTHAAMAVLLMVGISLFTVPSPDFGPPILAMALWAAVAAALLARGDRGARRSWYGLGVAAALLLLTSDAALLLLGALVAVHRGDRTRARRAPRDRSRGSWRSALVPFLFLHLIWLGAAARGFGRRAFADARPAARGRTRRRQHDVVAAAARSPHPRPCRARHPFGAGRRLAAGARNPAPPLARAPIDAFALTYVKVFALVPGLLATIVAVVLGRALPVGGAAPLVVLSGLALVIAAGDSIALYHQRILGFAWAGLLIVPAIFVPILIVLLPWTAGMDLKVAQPANAMGRFFADSFERRTGQPLAVVTGDPRLAALVALAAPSRPSVFFRRRSGAFALGHRRRHPQKGRGRSLARA